MDIIHRDAGRGLRGDIRIKSFMHPPKKKSRSMFLIAFEMSQSLLVSYINSDNTEHESCNKNRIELIHH